MLRMILLAHSMARIVLLAFSMAAIVLSIAYSPLESDISRNALHFRIEYNFIQNLKKKIK